jgi:hypothetical protein
MFWEEKQMDEYFKIKSLYTIKNLTDTIEKTLPQFNIRFYLCVNR